MKLAVFLFIIMAWSFITIGGNISPVILPSPAKVAHTFWNLLTVGYQNNTLGQHVLISVMRILVGFLAAAVTGILLGFAMSANRFLMNIFDPIIQLLTPIPPLIYIPLLQVWFGIGELPKILLIYICTLPFVVIGSISGVQSSKESMIRMSQSFGANPIQIFRYVVVPSALPEIITSLRLSLGRSWTCVVAAEMIAASSGLGWIGNMAGLQLQTDVVFVAVLCIAMLGLIMDTFLRWLQRRWVYWEGK
ncbi:taurine ABC transporter permease [Cohnella abietis]|uniref:Taurine ABC transporter permease n=2 Tax=Cohnella abietis TaxID=2507935 RepID=A0A3T1D5H3_9BACL|nr:taurine ABC transporter permease [Cohnella abietis]